MDARGIALSIVFLICMVSPLEAQDRSPIFLGVVSSEPDKTTILYSVAPDLPVKSQFAFFSEIEGYACCFKIEGKVNTTSSLPVHEGSGKSINGYKLSRNKAISKKLPYDPIFGAALRRDAHVKRIDDTNFVVTYEKRKAKLRMCTSIESIHIYFQEEGAGEPMAHLYYPLDYGVDPTCEETLKALGQNKPSALP
jgi:hypothetical protein